MTKLSTNPKDHLWNQRAQMCTRIHKQPDWSGGTMRNKEGGKEGRGRGGRKGRKRGADVHQVHNPPLPPAPSPPSFYYFTGNSSLLSEEACVRL